MTTSSTSGLRGTDIRLPNGRATRSWSRTVGLDDRAWVDLFGYPKSTDARVEERYRRVDADTLEIELTLYDPQIYTTPWVSDTKTWKKQPRDKMTFFGWYGVVLGSR